MTGTTGKRVAHSIVVLGQAMQHKAALQAYSVWEMYHTGITLC